MIKNFIKKISFLLGYEILRKQQAAPYIELKSENTDKLTFYKTNTGDYFLPTDAKLDIVANTIISGNVFDQSVVDIASKYIKLNTVVLDIGSNYGQMSIMFSNLVGEHGKVHAFDANHWVYEILKMNIEANGKTQKIIPHFGAIHNVNNDILIFSEVDFVEWGTYGSYGIDYNKNVGQEVVSVTIDSFCFEDPISFMKIDIQGGDLNAMKGAVNTIKKHKMPILFEYEYLMEERFNFNFQEYVDFVNSIDYKFYKVINGHNFLIIPK